MLRESFFFFAQEEKFKALLITLQSEFKTINVKHKKYASGAPRMTELQHLPD